MMDDPVTNAISGYLMFQLLTIGIRNRIFDQLAEFIDCKNLSQKTHCDERYLKEWCQGQGRNRYPREFLSEPARIKTLIIIFNFSADIGRSVRLSMYLKRQAIVGNTFSNFILKISRIF